jgi:hypothetical protein
MHVYTWGGGGGGGGGVMGRKRGVERGPLEIFLHLLGGQDEIINESTQNHQPPPPDKK